jgi:hypothetical protein
MSIDLVNYKQWVNIVFYVSQAAQIFSSFACHSKTGSINQKHMLPQPQALPQVENKT